MYRLNQQYALRKIPKTVLPAFAVALNLISSKKRIFMLNAIFHSLIKAKFTVQIKSISNINLKRGFEFRPFWGVGNGNGVMGK